MSKQRKVSDIEGPWVQPDFESSLIKRCRENWDKPINNISNEVLATFLRQGFALELIVPEANRRIKANFIDGTELYEEELINAINEIET